MEMEPNVTWVCRPSSTMEMQWKDSDYDEVENVYDETSHYMTNGGAYDASLHEHEDYNLFDTYDLQGLTLK